MYLRVWIVAVLLAAAHTSDISDREKIYKLNNTGVALMEEFKHEAAAAEFKKALELRPEFLTARINLALAYYYLRNKQAAIDEAQRVLKVAPQNPHMHYMLGLIYRTANQPEQALVEMEQVAAIDPDDVGVNINLGMLYNQKQNYEKALEYLRRAVAVEPYNATANYALAIATLRKGDRVEGQRLMEHFQKLRSSDYATTFGQLYFEQGRYSECIETVGNEPDLVSKDSPNISFTSRTLIEGRSSVASFSSIPKEVSKEVLQNPSQRIQLVSAFASGPYPIDYDGDADMDLLNVAADGVNLYRNDSGKLSDVTERLLPKLTGVFSGAVAADYDNDSRVDLLLFGYKSLRLLRNTQDGFVDVTEVSKLPVNTSWTLAAAFVDLDHDGDTDLYLGNFVDLDRWPGGERVAFPEGLNGQPNLALRNNGNGTFTDITEASRLSADAGRTVAIVPVDFNNSRDIDIIVINYKSAAQVFSNERTGTFKEVAAQVGLHFSGATYSVAAGDLNKDGYVDLCIPTLTAKTQLYLSNGRGIFKQSTLEFAEKAYTAQTLDYDNDGLLDVLTAGYSSINIARNLGSYFSDASVGLAKSLIHSRTLAVVDLDSDGGLDLVSNDGKGGLAWYQNEGAAKAGWTRIDLKGRVSNRSGIGARVEIRSGSLKQRLEVFAASPTPSSPELHFGLGGRKELDAVRVVWPAGIVQPERSVAIDRKTTIQELDRKGTSCPLLYVWNGKKYEFVTDLLGGCAIGYLESPGHFNYPDTDEYVLVRGEQISLSGNRYRISLNNQLEEVIFFDEVKLLAIDHPADTEVYPNERLMPAPPYPDFKVWTVKDPRPPVAAWGNHGQDILEIVSKEDRVYLEDFSLLPFKGYAQLHTLTLDLGDISSERLLLLLTAWIDYADSTSNLAASQAGVQLIPPYLQALNSQGEWQTVIDSIGFPAGLPKTMTVDLTGKLPQGCRQIRIVTNMRIYWDKILIDRSGDRSPVNITRLSPVKAELSWYGFPKEYRPQGRPPIAYKYAEADQESPWKVHKGNYTRYGDVLPLLFESEDFYVITRSGDRIEIEFDASELPVLAQGWRRDFLVYADGFGKDMDINSARPDTVAPLPFHRMSSYPYPQSESYPDSDAYREYMEKYNTRRLR